MKTNTLTSEHLGKQGISFSFRKKKKPNTPVLADLSTLETRYLINTTRPIYDQLAWPLGPPGRGGGRQANSPHSSVQGWGEG